MSVFKRKRHILTSIDDLLNEQSQIWLLGAGISKRAGIPLMRPLTHLVRQELNEGKDELGLGARYQSIQNCLRDDANVEHILSHLGDMIALAKRSAAGTIDHAGSSWDLNDLQGLHESILSSIQKIIRWGAHKDEDGNWLRWDHESSGVTIEGHCRFVEALYGRRQGRNTRTPISFFTTNYDTLLEDALGLCETPIFDGFAGGAIGFWDPGDTSFKNHPSLNSYAQQPASIFKLHGSIDWVRGKDNIVLRQRYGANYPDSSGSLLIYPQATKYELTQKDPFASLFSAFRTALSNTNESRVLAVCGYSFGDDHINEEITRALCLPRANLTLLAFVCEAEGETAEERLPDQLWKWLNPANDWCEQVYVATNHGVYHGSLENQCHVPDGSLPWWKFSGLTRFLNHGPQALQNHEH